MSFLDLNAKLALVYSSFKIIKKGWLGSTVSSLALGSEVMSSNQPLCIKPPAPSPSGD